MVENMIVYFGSRKNDVKEVGSDKAEIYERGEGVLESKPSNI